MAHPRAMAAWTHVRTPIRRADRGKAFIKLCSCYEIDELLHMSVLPNTLNSVLLKYNWQC
uniref:Uncharacterized protein n=1 Tax=Oryza sativa subsp. japonica TaxID=39947 RepID=Q84YX0_ORYSJ|nr:hypothetical protein [Oryza sativa Japonica Group]